MATYTGTSVDHVIGSVRLTAVQVRLSMIMKRRHRSPTEAARRRARTETRKALVDLTVRVPTADQLCAAVSAARRMPLHLEAPPILRALLVEVAGWRISRTASRALKVDATMQAPAFPKHRAIRSPTWLSLIRELSCCVCGKPGPSDAHHAPPKGRSGGGSDFETMPL